LRLILVLLLATGLASAVFLAFPNLDLATARLFFDGTAFPIAANRPVEMMRQALFVAEDVGFLLSLGLSLRGKPWLDLPVRAWRYLMLVFVLGPGLLVNAVLKPIWDRARPFQIAEFGGTGHFTPAWVLGDPCCGYRSFVSGEMAGAVALAIGLAAVAKANRGLSLAVPPILALTLFTAWQRMAAGRHFLSDIVLAALLILTVGATLHHMLGRPLSAKRC
jgi:lipid A 4'-phosphatase